MIEKMVRVSYLWWTVDKDGINRPEQPGDRDELDREAVAWLVRLTSGEATQADEEQARAWRARSASHEQAFQAARRVWDGMEPLRERIPQLHTDLRTVPLRGRQTSLQWGAIAAMLALITLGIVYENGTLSIWLADHHTATGQQQSLRLADGTVAHLNTDTALSVEYSDQARRVTLLTGEAAFVVAKDSSRPFIVNAAAGAIEAVGTEFVVRRNADRITVTMLEGSTRVTYGEGRQQPSAATPLHAPQRVQYSQETGLGHVEQADLRLESAWRRGKLIFEGAPLSTVLQEINRYRPGHVWTLRQELAAMPVSGVFDLDRLDEAVTVIEHTLHLKVVSVGHRWIFLL
ncbi:putative FecR, ferric citrate sensor [Nitrospira sp. KM1]|uniref:FecR family protein n=1 Tax=Nitrospira sp. KM1 TaxID=1936990 RepID=UPI0013A73A5F|nr:FecR family protein [Nitrospira sp. KM1]BCA56619.1 putative FecR, ferric citrate sensor [Nitrospira sp. KM1]